MKRRHMIRGLFALLVMLLVVISLRTFQPEDWPGWGWNSNLLQARNAFGFIGALIAKILIHLLGNMALFILPPFLLIGAVTDFVGWRRARAMLVCSGAALLALLWGGSGLWDGANSARVGWLGTLLADGMRSLTGETGSLVVLVFLTLIGILFCIPGSWLGSMRAAMASIFIGGAQMLGRGLAWFCRAVWRGLSIVFVTPWNLLSRAARAMAAVIQSRVEAMTLWRRERAETCAMRENAARVATRESRAPRAMAASAGAAASHSLVNNSTATSAAQHDEEEILEACVFVEEETVEEDGLEEAAGPARKTRKKRVIKRRVGAFELPPFSLLQVPDTFCSGTDRDYLEEQAKVMVDKLASYNIGGRVSAMSAGPVVTTYEFEPDTGVKVSQIVSRKEDLALALRSKELRMVAPIPGKAAVGVEVPNQESRIIWMREVLEAAKYRGEKGDLALALGVDVDGHPFWTDLSAMPHLLVAGATGTGKSVCINTLLISLLLSHTPDTLKLFLIDPKMLELSVYNDIPHLLHPVITDNRVALQALNWLVGEMERRYQLLKPASVRSIGEYNEKIRAGALSGEDGEKLTETMPFLVAVVEEFADLIMTQGKDIQTPIVRLAQMARAVGIHLILATQRPSVDIIDGVIKANFPSRIAFKVFSRVDSKTILDGNGAETLIGRGDMLFKHGRHPFPVRVHGAYVSTEEVEKIVEHWRAYKPDQPALELETRATGGGMAADDELYGDALEIVVRQGFGSTTMLQRRLRVGYTRASRLMDMLEDAGVVGPHTGSKAREVLVGPEVLEDHEGGL